MRHTSQKRNAPDSETSKTCGVGNERGAIVLDPDFQQDVHLADSLTEDALLLTQNSLIAQSGSDAGAQRDRSRRLPVIIRKRIESRLAGRVRNLSVRMEGEAVVLEGRCATYYTKQLAQHAALGVLEDEQLENAIVVDVPQ
jgi:hypothetical protein